ncbi:hypothetical protein ACVI1K_003258 [Bradyrhizobium sp. USDA 4508]
MRSRVLLLGASETATGKVRLLRRLNWRASWWRVPRGSFTNPYGQSIFGDADRFDVMRRHNPHLPFG